MSTQSPLSITPEEIIHKYYASNQPLEELLLLHSRAVARKALAIAERHPEWNLDHTFIYEAAMLHDIGVFYTDAPSIHCHGTHPYICHGILGAELLRNEGLPRHARVAERHTGTNDRLHFTIISLIFQPLTMITGWYGMNFKNMRELEWEYGYLFVIILNILIVLIISLIFKKKKLL